MGWLRHPLPNNWRVPQTSLTVRTCLFFVCLYFLYICLFVCVSERSQFLLERLWASGYQRLWYVWYMDGWMLKANVPGLMYWTTRAQPRQIQIHKYTNTQIHKYMKANVSGLTYWTTRARPKQKCRFKLWNNLNSSFKRWTSKYIFGFNVNNKIYLQKVNKERYIFVLCEQQIKWILAQVNI